MDMKKKYKKLDKKLYGKELDAELSWRHQCKEQRQNDKLSFKDMAKKYHIKASDVLAWEYGYDCCPHEEIIDTIGGFPMPKFLVKQCKKCGKIQENTTEVINDKNRKKALKIYKSLMKEF